MVTADGVLMSIRPVHAEAILSGEKTVELRRRRPSFSAGTTVLIYSSSPQQRVQGMFESGGVISADPDGLWQLVSERAGVSREVFDSYFAGCEVAYAIEVTNPRRLPPSRLRLRPPQSYLFLRRANRQHQRLLSLATAV